MQFRVFIWVLIVGSVVLGGNSTPDATRVIDRFELSQDQKHDIFPRSWKSRKDHEGVYTISCLDSNCALRAISDNENLSIGTEAEFDPRTYGVFSWRWKVVSLPSGASELKKETNDSAAGVFVLFDILGPMPRMIKYVWSSTVEPGTVFQSPSNHYVKMFVLRSGSEQLGEWVDEQRNLVDDYRKCFGKNPPKVQGIGVLTDSDNTGSRVEAWYDDFVVSKM